MNDFTKEELESIRNCIDVVEEDHQSTWDDKLYKKIQSLIDNYCEHNEGYIQDSMMVDICKKCGECF